MDDVLSELTDSQLTRAVEERGFFVYSEDMDDKVESASTSVSQTDRELYEYMCDMFGKNHFTPVCELVSLLENKLSKFA